MKEAREIVTLGLQARQKVGIPVRQPLNELIVVNYKLGIGYEEIIKDELNIKNLKYIKAEEKKVELDTYITEDLKQEGHYRELVRAIQDMRKKAGLNPSDLITIEIETSVEGQEVLNKFKMEFLKSVGIKEVKIRETEGEEIKIGDLIFKVKIEK